MSIENILGRKHEPDTSRKIDVPQIKFPEWFKTYQSYGSSSESWGFRHSDPHIKIPAINRRTPYLFVQSIPSEPALNAIRKSETAKDYEKDDKDFYFDANLMNFYLQTLANFAKANDFFYHQYPRVDTSGGCGNIGTSLQVRWPIVHMLQPSPEPFVYENPNSKKLKPFHPKLGESPHEKFLAEKLEILRKSKVAVLQFVGEHLTIFGDQVLREGQPFRLYSLSHHYNSSRPDDD